VEEELPKARGELERRVIDRAAGLKLSNEHLTGEKNGRNLRI
jgi:hypothetical protein